MYCLFDDSRCDVPNLEIGLDFFLDSAILPNVEEDSYAPGPGEAAEFVNRLAGTCGFNGPCF